MAGAKKIEHDHYLFREGDAPDAMYVIKSGKFVVVKSKQNSEIVLAEIGPGAMVGEMAFFDNKPRSASVRALKDGEVIALPYKALHAQFANFPEWCKAIMRTVNDHLRNANQRIKQLEKGETDNDLFPPHVITKLVSILNLVGTKYGTFSEEDKGLVINGGLLRNYTIQVFQEPTHKMQKLMTVLMDLNFMKVEEIGEGRQKIIIFQPALLYDFVEWYNEWLFKRDTDRLLIKEEELKVLRAISHYAKLFPPNEKGLSKLNITQMQNESMKDLGYLVRIEDLSPLIEKKLIGDKIMDQVVGESVLYSMLIASDIDRLIPFWNIIYTLKKVTR